MAVESEKTVAVLRLIERSEGKITFAEIGRRLGISREWARTLARRAGSDVRMRVVDHCAGCGTVYTALLSEIREGRRLCSLCSSQPRVPTESSSRGITVRQGDLLMHVASGKSYQEVAEALGISPHTVKCEMHRLMKRIGARNSAHALAIAVEHGWIEIAKHQGTYSQSRDNH